MKSTMTALGALLAGAALAIAPANAQAQAQPQAAAQQEDSSIRTHSPKVSREATKAIQTLQAVVDKNNVAEFPAALAAAQAAARTNDDRYMVAILQLKAAAAAEDNQAIAAAIEAMLASGSVRDDERFGLHLNLARTYDALKQAESAGHHYQLALQHNPNSVDATAGLAESKVAQGQTAEGLALLQKGIALQASGGRPNESWLKRALQIAYNAKLPQAVDLSRQWVSAYPTNEAWQNSLAIYQNMRQLDDDGTLDLLRLKRAVGVLSAGDYFNYSDIAVRKGNPGEAVAVLEQGFAANAVSRSDSSFSQLYSLATTRAKGDRESLPATPAADSNARQTLNVADAYFGYGDYSKAAEFYRAALSRPGANADLINLRLGMALARQGDRAGATAALNAVGSTHSDLAQYWLVHLNTKA